MPNPCDAACARAVPAVQYEFRTGPPACSKIGIGGKALSANAGDGSHCQPRRSPSSKGLAVVAVIQRGQAVKRDAAQLHDAFDGAGQRLQAHLDRFERIVELEPHLATVNPPLRQFGLHNREDLAGGHVDLEQVLGKQSLVSIETSTLQGPAGRAKYGPIVDESRRAGQVDRPDRQPVRKLGPQQRVGRPFQLLEPLAPSNPAVLRREKIDKPVFERTLPLQFFAGVLLDPDDPRRKFPRALHPSGRRSAAPARTFSSFAGLQRQAVEIGEIGKELGQLFSRIVDHRMYSGGGAVMIGSILTSAIDAKRAAAAP